MIAWIVSWFRKPPPEPAQPQTVDDWLWGLANDVAIARSKGIWPQVDALAVSIEHLADLRKAGGEAPAKSSLKDKP